MSETPETPTRPTTVAAGQAPVAEKPYWLYRFAAWVVIVAGIVFIVATVFFTGFKIAHIGHHGCHDHGRHHPRDQGPGPQGMHHHGERPALHHDGFGGPGPSQLPESVSPSPAPPSP